ncbi:MAG: cytochrome P450 [Ilumatobacteraceae bacterium]|nr:cytochrome P450 [Ilumatobacteraceae bacterium]
MSDVSFNPFDPEFRKNPHPFYDRLRTEEPVHRTPLGFVVLTRYEDVVNTLRNNDFSRDIEVNANLPESPTRKFRRENERSKSMLNLDPPDHTRLRRLVSKSFTPSAIEKLRPRIQQLVDDALANAKRTGHLELVEELAFPVPFQVISDLLAMPTERGEELREWSQIITATLEPTTGVEELEKGQEAIAKMRPYLEEIIQHRRRNIGDDMLSSLIAVEEQGEKLNNDELMSFVILLYIAGHETTVNLIGNSVHALLTHPEQLDVMRRESCTPNMVDELLRFNGPVQHTIRTPLVDISIPVNGQEMLIKKGSLVLASLGAGNHDPSVFDNPHQLDFSRSNSNRHLAFAAGVHYCLGASLAKLETEVAVGTLVKTFKSIEFDSQPEWRDRLTIRGVSKFELNVK